MRNYVVLADEALLDVVSEAEPMVLTKAEVRAERDLALLSGDKSFYDMLTERAAYRRRNPTNRYRSEGAHAVGKFQNKLLDAYQLMKQGDRATGITDQYNRKAKGGAASVANIEHTDGTLYVNVMVKNSVQVVRHELQRLAKERWEMGEEAENYSKFERLYVRLTLSLSEGFDPVALTMLLVIVLFPP
jgi:hypothetical protein